MGVFIFHIVRLVLEEYLEGGRCLDRRCLLVSDFVEVVVHDLTQVDQHVLLDLHFGVFLDLDARCVHNAQISDVVLTVFANNHKLGLP